MRVLHVGSGFRPLLTNGLVIYAEELMAGQLARGHTVGYFFPGRHYPLLRRPRLHRWRRDNGVRMFEWLNSPIVIGALRGTLDPEPELAHPGAEEIFRRVLAEFSPDVVHVHDLAGLPSSLVEVARAAGVPITMSLHDYFLLCPVVRLYDVEGRICRRREPGEECARCCSTAPRDNVALRDQTLGFEGMRARERVPGLAAVWRTPLVAGAMPRVGRALASLHAGPPAAAPGPDEPPSAGPAVYDRRRDVNVERLNAFDLLLALSPRSAEIYADLGVGPGKLRLVEITSGHLERLRPTRVAGTREKLTFVALATMTSRQKGADLLLAALRRLAEWGLDDAYRLLVGGYVPPDAERELRAHPGVVLRGPYATDELDALLDDGDVGLMASVWEEVSGLIGREFLAKGLPVVANALGGMVDYTREGDTGWLNRTNDADGLARIMADLIRAPGQVAALSRGIIERRDELILPMERHVAELDEVYADLRRSPAPVGQRSL